MKYLSKLPLFLLAVFFASLISCNQTKESVFKQKYHDLTAHYNAYFNAKEAYNQAYRNLLKNHEEDYSELLPLYSYGTPEDASAYSSDFQRVIDKATIAISNHEISKWSDNSYLLIGKSFYLQGDYDKAIETFQYITSEFKDGYKNEIVGKSSKSKNRKKKKKRRVSAEDDFTYGAFEHMPSSGEALIWLAKTYAQKDQFDKAESIITFASDDPEFPTNLDKELAVAKTFLKLEKEDYRGSLVSLHYLINASNSKNEKSRYYFILGQVHSLLDNYKEAELAFKGSLNNHANYEMAFYAKLKNARLARKSGTSGKPIKEQLTKMARDGKNEEFLDQIYYELAEIEIENDNFYEAVEYLNKSVKASVSNDAQKGLSYLRLGELFYSDEMYPKAKTYYDSAIALLPSDLENIEEVEFRQDALSQLVAHLDIIAAEDSLQALASISDSELRKIINKKISEKIAIEKAAAQTEDDLQSSFESKEMEQNQGSNFAFNTSKGNWYFYNPAALSRGYNSFISKWGKRKLEDNWRRKDKSSLFESDDEEITFEEEERSSEIDQSEYAKWLANIPTGKEEVDASNERLINAFYSSGVIYKDDIKNYKKAIEQFEELSKRFPGNELELETFYNLYLTHKELGNTAKEDLYKNKILAEYPTSKIARILSDPSYADKLLSEDDEVNAFYKKSYALYQQGNYDEVIDRNNQSRSRFDKSSITPKMEFLAALSIGQKGDIPQFQAALTEIISKYPGDEVKPKAEEILLVLNGEELPVLQKEDEIKEEKPSEKPIAKEKEKEALAMNQEEMMTEEEKAKKLFQEAVKNAKPDNSNEGFFGSSEENESSIFGDTGEETGGFGDMSEEDEEESGTFSFGSQPQEQKENPSATGKGNKGGNKSGKGNNNNTSSKQDQNNNDQPSKDQPSKDQPSKDPLDPGQQEEKNKSSSKDQKDNSLIDDETTKNEESSEDEKGNSVKTGNQNKQDNTGAQGKESEDKKTDRDIKTPGQTSDDENNDDQKDEKEQEDLIEQNVEDPSVNTLVEEENENEEMEQQEEIDETESDEYSNLVPVGEEYDDEEKPMIDSMKGLSQTEVEESLALNTEKESPEITEEIDEQPTPIEEKSEEELKEEEEEGSYFGISNNAPHYYILTVDVTTGIEGLQDKIDQFNSQNYNSSILRTTTMNLAGKKLLICKKFKSANIAGSYMEALEKNSFFSNNLEGKDYDSFVISVLNYAILLGNKDFNKYLDFHTENY